MTMIPASLDRRSLLQLAGIAGGLLALPTALSAAPLAAARSGVPLSGLLLSWVRVPRDLSAAELHLCQIDQNRLRQRWPVVTIRDYRDLSQISSAANRHALRIAAAGWQVPEARCCLDGRWIRGDAGRAIGHAVWTEIV